MMYVFNGFICLALAIMTVAKFLTNQPLDRWVWLWLGYLLVLMASHQFRAAERE